ncbi:hypothetical protein C0J52_10913 [Blattella germanica]|nr:hypothetical protein C0J52_10913 [Blattella germanica]
MLENVVQNYWKLVVKRLHHIVPWLGGRMHFIRGAVPLLNSCFRFSFFPVSP